MPAPFLARYKAFVRRNRALLAAVEQGVAGLTWLVPEGDGGDVAAEAAASLVVDSSP
jgi:hypothetical protein